MARHGARTLRFNTQPPEGGCGYNAKYKAKIGSFNTQPPEGGCKLLADLPFICKMFQHTAARRRLPMAASVKDFMSFVSTHSRPKAAAVTIFSFFSLVQCFNTQPPEGGCSRCLFGWFSLVVFQHTAARRRLPNGSVFGDNPIAFQHTAARRRLRHKKLPLK